MNQVAEEILSYYGTAESDENSLEHIGMPRRSGRYPWGSGDDPYQHGRDFLSRVEELKKQGWTETPENIEKEFGVNTSTYRMEKSLCEGERRLYKFETAKRLKEKEGLGYTEIGRKMGMSESSVRSLLNSDSENRMKQVKDTANFLKDQVKEKGMIDVGTGVELDLGVSKEKLKTALYLLEGEGYEVYNGRFEQATNAGKFTTQKVLCPPGTPYKEIYKLDNIHTITEYTSHDDGKTFDKFTYPKSMDSKRLMIRYKEDGGIEKDGLVELRRGVEDISLGNDKYSQVRILVDGTHYIKGMAVYSDNMPPGVDIVFNTNKSKGTPALGPKDNTVLKTIKGDPDNPFGALIMPKGQRWYNDKNGQKQLSLINKTRAEGEWNEWKDALPSQFLSKQSLNMVKKQLKLAKSDKLDEYADICSLENPTIKKHFLEKFADGCDAAAVSLKASALPGQKYHVIIPDPSLKDDEVYAPGYESGSKLALIRYPHGGTFEIPILKVNNKRSTSKKLIGTDSIDAICINSKVAERLSGADFDGDTVMCIPTHDKNGKIKITSTPPLKGLEGFDPKMEYPKRPGMKVMKRTDLEMGKISNLITDMTLAGADDDDLAAAVRHSMVVIDAEKHELDYKRSEIQNNIKELNKKYRRYIDENGVERVSKGASTIVSKAKGEERVDKRQGSYHINVKGSKYYDPTKPEGSKIHKTAEDLYYTPIKKDKKTGNIELNTVDGKKISYPADDKDARAKYEPIKKVDPKTGKIVFTNKSGDIEYEAKKRTQMSTKMEETDDAMTLVSPSKHPKEIAYADYANSMKALANKARLEILNAGKIEYDKQSKVTYQKEVDSLMAKLNNAELNRIKERTAQRKANVEISNKRESDPDMKKEDVKKAKQQAITKYRKEVGSIARRDRNIEITDREWEAIQAGAISETKLKRILNNTDIDKLRERAMPKTNNTVSQAKINRIKALAASNYTLDEIARKLGLSPSSVSKYVKGAK